MGKAFKFLIIPILMFILLENSFSQNNHVYINGKVINFSNNTIQIDTAKEVLFISKEARIVKHVRKGNSIYEDSATLKELKPSDFVTLKVVGNTVYELIIEVYRR